MRSRTHTRTSRAATSLLALATVMVVGASPAAAQSLQGLGTFTHGSGSIVTDTNTTDITVTSSQAVIDWTPFDNAVGNLGGIGFQYDGTTATFSSSGEFAVLNRINVADPTRIVGMDGIINGLVGGQPGGSIYFYSPSGFVIGANAVINVGSLVLTASPVSVDGNGLFISGPDNTVVFGQTGNPAAQINIVGPQGLSPGASITTSNYVAMVAPSITHSGAISTANQAALVAAEAATISFSPSGLFDIQVTSGTTDSAGITVSGTGSIGGPQGDGLNGDHNRIYMVAVPKNQAMTMAIQSGATLGFDIAGAADVVGNAIVLSSGYNVVDGQVDKSNPFVNGTQASINIVSSVSDIAITSSLYAAANDTTFLTAQNGGELNIAGDAYLYGAQLSNSYSLGAGSALNFARNVEIRSDVDVSQLIGVNADAGEAILGAGNGSTTTVGGDLIVSADATGGNASGSGATGGQALGGIARVYAQSGGTLTVGGDVDASADGRGGNNYSDGGNGGIGRGGLALVQAGGTGSTLTIGGEAVVTADGQGGDGYFGSTLTCTLCTGVGGTGIGGQASISTSAGTNSLTVTGNAYISTNATGGEGDAAGGDAIAGGDPLSSTEGAVATFAANSTLNFNGGLTMEAIATGGYGSLGAGGNAEGGRVRSGAQDGATGGTLNVVGLTELDVTGIGGNSGSGTGGIGRGGQSDNGGNSGTINYDNVTIIADGRGGSSANGTGGAGYGGLGWVDAFGSVITVDGDYFGYASGVGGDGAAGGLGDGGRIVAAATSSNLTVTGDVQLYAEASGGTAFNGNGGDALGGDAEISARNGQTVTIGGDAYIFSDASGGVTFDSAGSGGNATGGNSYLLAQFLPGSTVSIAGELFMDASGTGGSAGEGGALQGGSGTGGLATIVGATGPISIGGSAFLNADGIGGIVASGTGGLGSGGTTNLFVASGSIAIGTNIEESLFVSAAGVGGEAFDGNGGDAFGGYNTIEVNGPGSIDVAGSVFMDGSAEGGDGNTGGDATARITLIANEVAPDAATIVVRGGGDINIGGAAFIAADATGGNGSYGFAGGNGGNALAGEFDINSYNGTITMNGLFASAVATGGDGGNGAIGTGALGGNGGQATGGIFDVSFGPSNQPVNGTITLGDVLIDVSAIGGSGGAGADGLNGGDGGNGGAALFQFQSTFVANGAGGTLNAGTVDISYNAVGGSGGAGGNATNGTGGDGGTGGNANAGALQAGSISNNTVLSAGGAFTTGDLTMNGNAQGGTGGDGGSGTLAGGSGGDGGNAGGGGGFLGIRGVIGTVADVLMYMNATGGDGGQPGDGGAGVGGIGGNATGGRLAVESRERFGFPNQRGTLIAGDIYGEAIAVGGAGLIQGVSTAIGDSSFLLFNGDATINSLQFVIQADNSAASGNDWIAIIDGTAVINGDFRFETPNDLALYANRADATLNQASLTATNVVLSAGNFIPFPGNAVTETEADPAVRPGTFFADTFSITSDENFYTTATLDSVNDLNIGVPGSITVGNINVDADVDLLAQDGSVSAGDILALGAISINANGSADGTANVVTGNLISTGSGVTVIADDLVTVGVVDSFDATFLLGSDGVNFTSITAGAGASLYSDGLIQGGDVIIDDFGLIEISTGGSINVGNLLAVGRGVTLSAGGTLSTLDITALDEEIIATSSGDMTLGDLTAGTLIGLSSNGDIIAGDLDSGGTIDARNAGTGTYGNVTSVGSLYLGAIDNLTFLEMVSGEVARFGSDTTVVGGNITAGDSVIGTAIGNITVGNLSAGQVSPSANPNALYEAVLVAGSINAGNIAAEGEVQLAGFGGVTAGNIDTPARMFAVSDGAISLGNLNIGGQILFGGWDMFAFTGDLWLDFDASPTFDSILSPVLGNLSVGDVLATSLLVRTLGDFGAGTVNVANLAVVEADGDIVITGPVNADVVDLQSLTGSVTTGNLAGNFGVTLHAFNAITTGDIVSGGSINLLAGGNVTAGDLFADSSILIDAGGDVSVGDALAGLGIGSLDVGSGNPVEMFGANIAAGDISTDGYVGLYTPGNVATGSIAAGHDVLALVGGDASFGAISTPETFNLAGYSNTDQMEGPEGFDPALYFNIFDPDSTGGDAAFAGAVDVGSFTSRVGGATNVGDVTSASAVLMSSGGVVTIDGAVDAASYVGIRSGDLAITGIGSINAPVAELQSINEDGMFLGDGLTGTDGYRLSQAEFDRINTDELFLYFGSDEGVGEFATVGDLEVDYLASESSEPFSISSTSEQDGLLRIVGDVTVRARTDQFIEMEAGTFALDAATGSLSVLDGQGNLSGILALQAANIFVAEGSIIDKLLIDPRYAGYVAELNAPASVQRPEGVLRTASIELGEDASDVVNLLVQNTGTNDTPAGFLISSSTFGGEDEGEGIPEPGSINLVINGQIKTPTGTLTGVTVRDLLVAEFGTEAFVAGSTINGCELAGSCGGEFVEEVSPLVTVTPTQVAILTTDPLGEASFGNEVDIDDSVAGDVDDQGSPIAPPQPLFDSRALTDEGLINDPISGSGNPSLYGLRSDEDDDEEEEEVKKGEEAKPAPTGGDQ